METTETLNAYQLASLAGVASPDSLDSPGAKWLKLVASTANEVTERPDEDRSDAIFELAQTLVPIYTIELWQVFVDLAAWLEDINEFGPIEDMEKGAQIALLAIAERLLTALTEDDNAEDA